MEHLNGILSRVGGNLNNNFQKKSNARGVARGGMLKLRFDRYITVRAFLFRLIPDSIYGHLTFIGIGLLSLRRLQQNPQNGHKSAPEPHRKGKKKIPLRDRSLFITWGGSEDFGGDHLIFRRTEGGISRN